ncbi:unnamed protein product [Rotaria magnacalcarata]|uniref:Uncharacterized protein n=1 Tax=Rotaria magnacalcarata TaxID=392030 RepID=A0A816LN37_9BILA|nr:unnamed protein product [Rotaria magnacalcarata]
MSVVNTPSRIRLLARWYIRTKNVQTSNVLLKHSKVTYLFNRTQKYQRNLPTAWIATLLIFIIKLPYYIKRYSSSLSVTPSEKS